MENVRIKNIPSKRNVQVQSLKAQVGLECVRNGKKARVAALSDILGIFLSFLYVFAYRWCFFHWGFQGTPIPSL